MKHSTVAGIALSMLAPALLLTSTSALAASDVKSFSSNVCVPVGAAASNDLTYSHQGMFNTSTTSTRVVICPLVKDAESEWTTGLTSLSVQYKTPSGQAGTVNCTVYVGSLTSGAWSVTSTEPQRPANTIATMTLAPETEAGWVFEPVNLACSLSPRTRLTRIYLTETGVTNTP